MLFHFSQLHFTHALPGGHTTSRTSMGWRPLNLPPLNTDDHKREILRSVVEPQKDERFIGFYQGVQPCQSKKQNQQTQYGCIRCAQHSRGKGKKVDMKLSKAKEIAPRCILLPARSVTICLCTNAFGNTSVDSEQLCSYAVIQLQAVRGYEEQTSRYFQTKSQMEASCLCIMTGKLF